MRWNAILVTFASTVDAMAMEDICTEHQIPGRLIPLPASISAGCGLAWKCPMEQKEVLLSFLTSKAMRWERMYEL